MIPIDWESSASLVLMNPAYSEGERSSFSQILDAAKEWTGHLWLSTSGSTASKWVGLSKQALLASAAAVNARLQSTAEDRWVQTLPSFHVGGLGIWARAHLSGAAVFDYKIAFQGKWKAEIFLKYVQEVSGTLTALVPAQVYDCVLLGCKAPPSLRAVIVGGGALSKELYEQAKSLGWPLLPSYGLTECCSQVATAALESLQQNALPRLRLLSHLRACEREGRLCVAGSSLLSAYAIFEEGGIRLFDPKIDGWLLTEDRGAVQQGELTILGRADALIKIGGENVDFSRLEIHWQTLCSKEGPVEAILVAKPDQRLGWVIHLAVIASDRERVQVPYEYYQKTVLPFERIRQIHTVPVIPRSPLGKVLKSELLRLLE